MNNVDICLPPLKNRTPTAKTSVQHSPVNQTSQTVWKFCRQTQREYQFRGKVTVHFNKLKVETLDNKNTFLKNVIFKTRNSKLQSVGIRNMMAARTLDD